MRYWQSWVVFIISFSIFEKVADENNFQAPKTFNIREYAGWSKESKKSVPKISALINSSVNETKKTPSLTLNSLGRCFVYTNYKNGEDSLGIAFDFHNHYQKKLKQDFYHSL